MACTRPGNLCLNRRAQFAPSRYQPTPFKNGAMHFICCALHLSVRGQFMNCPGSGSMRQRALYEGSPILSEALRRGAHFLLYRLGGSGAPAIAAGVLGGVERAIGGAEQLAGSVLLRLVGYAGGEANTGGDAQ